MQIVQHLQGQASERTERLAQNMEKEAFVMRIVTIVTLLYLPATFVSVSPPCKHRKSKLIGVLWQTFFSTDVVKYQDSNDSPNSGTFSGVALTRWLQVTLPLTITTISGAWLTFKYAERTRLKRDKERLEVYAEDMESWRGFLSRLLPSGIKTCGAKLPVHHDEKNVV